MGLFRSVKKGVSSSLNVKRWVGLDHIKDNGRVLGRLFQTVLKKPVQSETTRHESFEECMRRFNMTEEDLQKRIKNGKKMVFFYLLVSIATFIYLIFLLSYGRHLAGFVCIMLTLLFLVYALREHFNIYQMNQRRLGCSFKTYFRSLFQRSK